MYVCSSLSSCAIGSGKDKHLCSRLSAISNSVRTLHAMDWGNRAAKMWGETLQITPLWSADTGDTSDTIYAVMARRAQAETNGAIFYVTLTIINWICKQVLWLRILCYIVDVTPCSNWAQCANILCYIDNKNMEIQAGPVAWYSMLYWWCHAVPKLRRMEKYSMLHCHS